MKPQNSSRRAQNFGAPETNKFLLRGKGIGLLALVLIIIAIGFFYNLIVNPIDVNFLILFLLGTLILYVLLKDIKLE